MKRLDPALITNADGSVDLFFGPRPPLDEAEKTGGAPPYFRLCGRMQRGLDKTWVPDIQSVSSGAPAKELLDCVTRPPDHVERA